MKQSDIVKLVDDYVTLDAKIKKLEAERNALKEQVVALGEGTQGGHKGSVSVSSQSRRLFKADKAKQFMTDDQFESCYEESKSVIVRVTFFDKVVK